MKTYTITNVTENNFNMVLTKDFISGLEDIINNLSLNNTDDFAIVSNIELFNNILYRKAIANFIKDLKDASVLKDNVTYTLNIIHEDDRHVLLIRNNVLSKQDGLYKGIQGITYGTTINN